MSETKQSGSVFRRGNMAAIALGVLTIIEFLVAIYLPSAILLLLLAIAKAGIIMQVFMNISRLWNPEESH